jgi:hypothetical protein
MEQISFAIDGRVQGLAAAFGTHGSYGSATVSTCEQLPSGYVKIANESGHRNSGFTH